MRLTIAALLFLSSCASAGHELVPGPNGLAYEVWCRRSQANCYREAARICGGKYTIASRRPGNTAIIPTAIGYTATTGPDFLLIECEKPIAAQASEDHPPGKPQRPPQAAATSR